MTQLTPFPSPETAEVFRGAMRTVAVVLRCQADAAERVTEDAALTLLADAEGLLRLITRLRTLHSDLRRDLAAPSHARDETDVARFRARQAAHDLRIDSVVAEIEAGVLGIFAYAQSQDIVRQILGGMTALSDSVCAIGLDELALSPNGAEAPIQAMEQVSAGFVMREQRMAYARAMGRNLPDDAPSLELF